MNQQIYFDHEINQSKDTKEKLFYAGVYLFAKDGYSNVGIRKLCSRVKIKESSFYNHYKSKAQLLDSILQYFENQNQKIPFTKEEVKEIINKEDVEYFFKYNMEKFGLITNSPLYFTILQIILRERFLREDVYKAELESLYYLRKGYTEEILEGLKQRQVIRNVNVKQVTQEYYYGLKGLLDEYLLRVIWDDNLDIVSNKIDSHLQFFIGYLKK